MPTLVPCNRPVECLHFHISVSFTYSPRGLRKDVLFVDLRIFDKYKISKSDFLPRSWTISFPTIIPHHLIMAEQIWETTDVIICGCGPTGALLSVYLGQMSISNVVLEKETGVTTDPRGIALDEDGIRLLQGAGIYDTIYTQTGTCKWLLQKLTIHSTQTDGRDRHVQF